ncbi:MAG: hypothetical protein LCH43_11350 [Actinobacteria bacterium]|nr:hypothetical protein [Actinomycetota bacterium]
MSETYEEYVTRLGDLGITALRRDQWARSVEREAWSRRTSTVDTVLNDEEVEKLLVELRDRNASHQRYPATVYQWADNCPHDTTALEEPQPYYIGDGPEHPDEDQHHKRNEDGELICLLSPVGEECVCGDGYCERLSQLRAEAEDFWMMLEQAGSNSKGSGS